MTARTGIAITGAVVCLASSGVLTGCASTGVMSLTTGDCLMAPSGDALTDVERRGCTSTHDAEVVGIATVPSDALPASDELDALAQRDCLALFEQYVGVAYADSSLALTWLVPTQQSWESANDRSVTCIATTADRSTMTWSVRDQRV